MFERFTAGARHVVGFANEEACLLHHNYIGTEHLLLGLMQADEGVAAQVLTSLGVSHEAAVSQIEKIIGCGNLSPSGHIPFTPRTKSVLEQSSKEAIALGHDYIGTEHILLSLVREGVGVGLEVLVKLGVDVGSIPDQVMEALSKNS